MKDFKHIINIHTYKHAHTDARITLAHKRPNKIQLKSKVLNLSGNSVINKTDYIYKRKENTLDFGVLKDGKVSEFLLLFRLQYRDGSGFCLTPVTSITITP